MQFPHEQLSVYQKALDFFGDIFLDTANAAAAKLAVLLDMSVRRGILDKPEADSGKGLLVRVGQMTARKDYAAR